MLCAFISEKSSGHGAICVICFSGLAFVCVCVFVHDESWGGFTPGGQAPAHFLSLSCVAQSGEALSPAICLPALGIVIPKYRPVNISLVTATSPQQHTLKKKAEQERRCSLLTLHFCPFLRSLCLFLHPSLSLYPPEPQKMAQFLSCSTCYLLNKTLLLF